MSDINSHTESPEAANNKPTGSYADLIAARSAIDAQLQEIETIAVPAMRERWAKEAASIGKTIEEVLGNSVKKPRGRKAKSKRDE